MLRLNLIHPFRASWVGTVIVADLRSNHSGQRGLRAENGASAVARMPLISSQLRVRFGRLRPPGKVGPAGRDGSKAVGTPRRPCMLYSADGSLASNLPPVPVAAV